MKSFFLDWLVQGSKSTPKGNNRKLLCNWCLFRKKPDKQMSSERHMPHRVAKSARGLSYKLLVRCGSQVRQWQMAYNIHCRDAFVHGNLPGFSWLSKNQKKKKKKSSRRNILNVVIHLISFIFSISWHCVDREYHQMLWTTWTICW